MNNELFISADQYISNLFSLNDDALFATEQSVEEAHKHDISVSPTQGKFLYLLAKLCRAEKILELGTFFGYSATWLARALPQHGRLITIEYDPQHAASALKNIARAGLAHKVDIRIGSVLELLPGIASENIAPFDMIFIDADKPPYAEYFQWALLLSKPGTLIIADNVIRHVFDPTTQQDKKQGVERFNKILAACPSVTATIIQNVGMKEPDGMAIAIVN